MKKLLTILAVVFVTSGSVAQSVDRDKIIEFQGDSLHHSPAWWIDSGKMTLHDDSATVIRVLMHRLYSMTVYADTLRKMDMTIISDFMQPGSNNDRLTSDILDLIQFFASLKRPDIPKQKL